MRLCILLDVLDFYPDFSDTPLFLLLVYRIVILLASVYKLVKSADGARQQYPYCKFHLVVYHYASLSQ